MKSPRRTPLEPWQVEDAKHLKRLFDERAKMSQETFGATFNIGTQGAVWQYLNGARALNIRVAMAFARGLDCSVSDFSPTLAAEMAIGDREANKVAEVFNALPPKAQMAVLDHLRYQVASARPTARLEQKRSEYMRDLEEIQDHMTPRPLDPDD